MRTILRGLEDLNLVGADIVEVAPAYDTNAELTTMAAADILYEVCNPAHSAAVSSPNAG